MSHIDRPSVQRVSLPAAVAAASLVVASTAAPLAHAATLDLQGEIIDARNLTFAVLDGDVISNPRASDLPLAYSATLSIDDVSGAVGFDFSGSFSEPGRSYNFDRSFSVLGAGLVENSDEAVRIEDQFTGFDFVLDLDRQTGTGSWTLFEPDLFNDDADLFVSAEIDNVSAVPLPAAAWLFLTALLSVGGLARRRQRRCSS